VEDIVAGVRVAREAGAELVIAIGGGSVIDGGKTIAALLTNAGDLLDYLEVIGRARPLERAAAPLIAIPTTAGTGAEVTRNAVLSSPQHRLKASLRSPYLLPATAVVDPELTYHLPPAITAATGLDALTQLIEPFVSSRANPLIDAVCREGIERAARSLRAAYASAVGSADGRGPLAPEALAAREDMALAGLLSGLALANAGLGAVHGFAAAIGGMFTAPHGAVCAALLPHVMEANIAALRARAPGSQALRRYDAIARWLTGRNKAAASEGIVWVRDLCRELQIPRLGHYGIQTGHVAELVEKASQASSMKGNPIALSVPELSAILQRAI
jgi:alcohol dehydrogenase class IV